MLVRVFLDSVTHIESGLSSFLDVAVKCLLAFSRLGDGVRVQAKASWLPTSVRSPPSQQGRQAFSSYNLGLERHDLIACRTL